MIHSKLIYMQILLLWEFYLMVSWDCLHIESIKKTNWISAPGNEPRSPLLSSSWRVDINVPSRMSSRHSLREARGLITYNERLIHVTRTNKLGVAISRQKPGRAWMYGSLRRPFCRSIHRLTSEPWTFRGDQASENPNTALCEFRVSGMIELIAIGFERASGASSRVREKVIPGRESSSKWLEQTLPLQELPLRTITIITWSGWLPFSIK